MIQDSLSEELIFELKVKGYINKIDLVNGFLFYNPKSIQLTPNDLFFVDGGYYNSNTDEYFFPISSPLFDIRSLLIINTSQFKTLTANGYLKKFATSIIDFKNELPSIEIKKQYGMRRVLLKEFDQERYELRFGFPDFPSCPYGHSFKSLGYDKIEKKYIRLASSILRKEEIKIINYKN